MRMRNQKQVPIVRVNQKQVPSVRVTNLNRMQIFLKETLKKGPNGTCCGVLACAFAYLITDDISIERVPHFRQFFFF